MKYSYAQSNMNMMTKVDAPVIFAESGSLEVRLAESRSEVLAAQALRYRIFYQEMGARPTDAMSRLGRDFDYFDDICDHLLVVDRSRRGRAAVVGTYRLLREEVIGGLDDFYSGQEYDIGPLASKVFRDEMGAGRQLLELGRSCVHADYRTNTTIHMLWRGIAGYTLKNGIGYMFGCASLPGTDPSAHKLALSYLHHEYAIPQDFRIRAHGGQFCDMNLMPREDIDVRLARRALPPLVKGYLRLGCYIGDGAVVDHQFGTTDVFILLPVHQITQRYQQHFQLESMSETRIGRTRHDIRSGYNNVITL